MGRNAAITIDISKGQTFESDGDLTDEEILREMDCTDLFSIHNRIILGVPKTLPEKSEHFSIHRFLHLLLTATLPKEERAKMLNEEYGRLSETEYLEEISGIMGMAMDIAEEARDEA